MKTPGGTKDPDPTHVPMGFVRDLWRELLECGSVVSVPLQGRSMLPTLLPGDQIRTEALAGPPAVGDVVVFGVPGGMAIAHRVLAVGRRGAGWAVVTAGDRFPHRPDGVSTEDAVLCKVIGYVRDGQPTPLAPVTPALINRMRGLWVLGTAGREDLAARILRAVREVVRGPYRALTYGFFGLPVAARSRPLVGPLVRLIWPDLRHRCQVLTVDRPVDGGGATIDIFVVWRNREVGGLSLERARCRCDDESRWWIHSASIKRRYRRRGLMSAAVDAAIDLAAKAGASEVYLLVGKEDARALSIWQRLGFELMTEGPAAPATVQRYLSAGAPPDAFLVLRRRTEPSGEASGTPTQGA